MEIISKYKCHSLFCQQEFASEEELENHLKNIHSNQ
ncbi:MAG: hypothetical protein GBAus27B_000605 [Mycoplasmataceae bacterium]|nr:MAG: hypothetical protein GBAus27B_000605 [Mycoplasmataceae bacterium]